MGKWRERLQEKRQLRKVDTVRFEYPGRLLGVLLMYLSIMAPHL